MAGPFRLLFFFSSFGPLYLIFAVKLYYNHGFTWMAPALFGTLSVLSFISFLLIRRNLSSNNGTKFKVSDLKAKDSEIFSYITTYIPPLITRDVSEPEVYLPLAILYTIIAIAYLRLDSPYLNPFFTLMGYRIYEGKLGSTKSVITIIAKRPPTVVSGEMILHEVGTSDLYYYAY